MSYSKPWFPFYASDWLNDAKVTALTLAEQGAYMRLLALQWREGFIPNNKRDIYKLIGFSALESQYDLDGNDGVLFSLEAVLEMFEEDPSDSARIINSRLEKIRHEAEKNHDKLSESGRKGALSRDKNRLRLVKASLKPGLSPAQAYSQSQSQSYSQSESEEEKKLRSEETCESPSAPAISAKPVKSKKPKNEPIPFTVAVALEALSSASNGRIIVAPFDQSLVKPITAVIRRFPVLEDWRAAAEWIGRSGDSWRTYDLLWLAKAGNLASAIGQARKPVGEKGYRPPVLPRFNERLRDATDEFRSAK